MERLSLPNDDIKHRLLELMDQTHFGPSLAITEERLEVVRSVLVEVLVVEDWNAILVPRGFANGQAITEQVQQRGMRLAA